MKKKQVKNNTKKSEKEKKLVQEIISVYSETFSALYRYDKSDKFLAVESKPKRER